MTPGVNVITRWSIEFVRLAPVVIPSMSSPIGVGYPRSTQSHRVGLHSHDGKYEASPIAQALSTDLEFGYSVPPVTNEVRVLMVQDV